MLQEYVIKVLSKEEWNGSLEPPKAKVEMKFTFSTFWVLAENIRLIFSSAWCLQTNKMPAFWRKPVLPDAEMTGVFALWRYVGAEMWLCSADGSLCGNTALTIFGTALFRWPRFLDTQFSGSMMSALDVQSRWLSSESILLLRETIFLQSSAKFIVNHSTNFVLFD